MAEGLLVGALADDTHEVKVLFATIAADCPFSFEAVVNRVGAAEIIQS